MTKKSPLNLKKSTPFIISPLNYICNKALSTGIFPSCLKYSVVKPLYLKGMGEGNIQQSCSSLQQ